ncbi:hypothetical protein ACMHYJ_14090 [Castellaniella hirudinis]|uniref:hypothetical protein n=1 Tax=Castellaniella hirudinis TaxID=1144617 RepID=UPI0039C41065
MTIALTLFLLAAIAGLSLLVAGTFVLAGPGWAFVAGGAALLVCAAFLRSGLRSEVKRA